MKDLIKSIFTILQYAGKTITVFRNIVFNTIFIGVIILFCLVFFTGEKNEVSPNSALLLSITGDIVEEKQIIDPISELFNETLGFSRLPEETLLQDILDAIYAAADDEAISAIVLDLSKMGTGSLNQIRDIGSALEYFKMSGKPVVAAEDYYTQNKYFLACYADKIFLNPIGIVDLHGLGAYRLYFHDALEKLKVNYHVFRVGSYKSALEPITRNSMSTQAKEQNDNLLQALWQEVENEIVTRRKISGATLEEYTNSVASLLKQFDGDTAQLALQTGLVDDLKSREQLRAFLIGISGYSTAGDFRHVGFKNYLKTVSRSYADTSQNNVIGVIVAQGNILTGVQPPGSIGSETMVKLLRQARNDSRVKAVVLRLNSGGGSVFASEIIRQELLELKASGKPYVVSMAAVAASGGYWISADADQIWAHPTTVTGSIGIFGAIPTFEKSLAHMGIYNDGTATAELASGLDLTQPLSPEIKQSIQIGIEHGYETFLSIVSSGRGLDRIDVERLAQGRVFDGRTAMKLGLIDKLGNLEDAIKASASLAGLQTYTAEYIRSSLSFPERLLGRLKLEATTFLGRGQQRHPLADRAEFFTDSLAGLFLFNDPKAMYAHYMIHFR